MDCWNFSQGRKHISYYIFSRPAYEAWGVEALFAGEGGVELVEGRIRLQMMHPMFFILTLLKEDIPVAISYW